MNWSKYIITPRAKVLIKQKKLNLTPPKSIQHAHLHDLDVYPTYAAKCETANRPNQEIDFLFTKITLLSMYRTPITGVLSLSARLFTESRLRLNWKVDVWLTALFLTKSKCRSFICKYNFYHRKQNVDPCTASSVANARPRKKSRTTNLLILLLHWAIVIPLSDSRTKTAALDQSTRKKNQT